MVFWGFFCAKYLYYFIKNMRSHFQMRQQRTYPKQLISQHSDLYLSYSIYSIVFKKNNTGYIT